MPTCTQPKPPPVGDVVLVNTPAPLLSIDVWHAHADACCTAITLCLAVA
jgi:hypothetical protein